MYLVLFLGGGMIISYIEDVPLISALFETSSAIGTVGLSLGLTPTLGMVSRLILILLMFFGRVGGLTLILPHFQKEIPTVPDIRRKNYSRLIKETIIMMKSILLIGLGRFGRHIAMKLDELNHQVMAIDRNEERVDAILPYVTNAQIGDATKEGFMESLGVRNFDVCIVAIGDNFQSSLEATSLLSELGANMLFPELPEMFTPNSS